YFYITTRFRPYNDARYVRIVFSRTGSRVLLRAAFPARKPHRSSLVSVRLRFWVAASNFRTLDVVSKLVFGTFNFGSHRLLDMPSLVPIHVHAQMRVAGNTVESRPRSPAERRVVREHSRV